MRLLGRNSKAIGSGTGGALALLIIWILSTFFKIEMPEEVAISLVVVLSIGFTWLFPPNKEPISKNGGIK